MKYLIVVLLLSVALNACSSSKEKPPVYLQSEDLAPLKYPDKLRTPKSTPLLAVPPLTHDNGLWGKALEAPPVFAEGADQVDLDEVPVVAQSKSDTLAMAKLSSDIKADPEGNQTLIVAADLDEVWPPIDPAVKRLGFDIDDSSRGLLTVTIFREIDELALEPDPDDPTLRSPDAEKLREEYQIKLKVDGAQTLLSIHNKDGKLDGSALARHLLVQLQFELAHPVP